MRCRKYTKESKDGMTATSSSITIIRVHQFRLRNPGNSYTTCFEIEMLDGLHSHLYLCIITCASIVHLLSLPRPSSIPPSDRSTS